MVEENKKFVIKSGIKTGKPEIDEYINDLHDYLISFETSNIKKLILSIDMLAGVLAEDITKIVEGEDTYEVEEETGEVDAKGNPLYTTVTKSHLKILSDYKDSKVYDRVMTLLQRVKDFELVSKTAKALVPSVEEYIEKFEQDVEKVDVKLSGPGNSFEQMQEKHMSKRKDSLIV